MLRGILSGVGLLVLAGVGAIGMRSTWRPADLPTPAATVPLVWATTTQQLATQQLATQPAQKKKKTGRKKQQQTPTAPPPELPPLDDSAAVLSSGDSYDDFTSIAQAADGTLYAAYAAYYDAHDQIRLHKRLPGGDWSTRTYVPLVRPRADIWMPQLAVDARDRVWV
ncbi:MAG: hypothetical protein AB7O38_31460, partial [Pirellulaceae bacterium]